MQAKFSLLNISSLTYARSGALEEVFDRPTHKSGGQAIQQSTLCAAIVIWEMT